MLNLNFKTWLEGISHQESRKIVLDALGAASADHESQNRSLTGTLDQHPDLARKLSSYTALRPYLSDIDQYVTDNPKSTIVELISYLANLDSQELPGETDEPQDTGEKGQFNTVV